MEIEKTILLSLKQEIYCLNELIGKIPKIAENKELRSWLIPTKNYDYISDFIRGNEFQNVTYRYCLEIAIDRLYIFMRLLLDIVKSSNIGCERNWIIVKPVSITLGLCALSVWESIQVILEKGTKTITTKTMLQMGNDEMLDQGTQTDIMALSKCDSCASAMMCMKNLLEMSNERKGSLKRNPPKLKIYDITQFGSMIKATSTIEEYFKELSNQLNDKKTENNMLKLKFDNAEKLLVEKDRKITFLQEEIKTLREKYNTEKDNLYTLREQHEDLVKKNVTKKNEIENLNKVTSKLQKHLNLCNKQKDDLKNENIILKKYSNTLKVLVDQHIINVTKNSGTTQDAFNDVECNLKQNENACNNLNISLTKLTKNIGKCELKIKTNHECTKEINEIFSKCQTTSKKSNDIYREKIHNLIENQSKPREPYKIKGNPVEDLSKQIQENYEKINELQSENTKLEMLLNRFKVIKNPT